MMNQADACEPGYERTSAGLTIAPNSSHPRHVVEQTMKHIEGTRSVWAEQARTMSEERQVLRARVEALNECIDMLRSACKIGRDEVWAGVDDAGENKPMPEPEQLGAHGPRFH